MSGRTAKEGLLCPVCRVNLLMSERQGIEIDYCPKCRGVWLDRSELDKIIERSASAEGGMANPQQPAPSPWTPQPPAASQQPGPAYGALNPNHDQGGYGHGGERHGGGHHGQEDGHGNSFLGRLFR